MPDIPIENQVISRIYGRGRGWAFSTIDFTPLAPRPIIDVALSRLSKKGAIRRVIRGIYDYPKYSELLKQNLSPDVDQVASALARKFGWYIQVTGPISSISRNGGRMTKESPPGAEKRRPNNVEILHTYGQYNG